MKLILSFPVDIEACSGQLKGYDESVVDRICLRKIKPTSFCFDDNLSFSSNILYYYFYLRGRVYMLSKIVWNYDQHLVSQSTAIWPIHSDLLPGFAVP